MKVLLTHSYFLQLDPKQLKSATPYPPLATLYAAALLRAEGFEVSVADLQFCSPREIQNHLDSFSPDAFVIYDDGFNYLTKMCLTNMRTAAFQMQKLAKRKNIPVFVSSSDASDHVEEYCRNGADAVIIGEAEHTLLELLRRSQKGQSHLNVPGIACINDKEISYSATRQVSRNLDDFPPPAFDLLDFSPYKTTWLKRHGFFSVNLVTTRGCPYKCNWCAKPIYGNRYNSHSPEYIVDLIKSTQASLGYSHIWFADDIFGLKPGWLREFAALMNKENILVKYKIQSRADLLLRDENIKHLAESGCEVVWMGAESGSQRILDAMDKGITTEEIKTAVKLLKQYKIKPALFLQFGYPGETVEDIKKTIELVNELMPHDIGVSVSYPLPGTKFYETVKSQLKEKSNWTDSDDLHLMFKNTYSPEFYKHLHRYLHHSFRAKQAGSSLKNFSFPDYRRLALLPWYKWRSRNEKNVLKKIEPGAAVLF